jgi:hypothetical protein
VIAVDIREPRASVVHGVQTNWRRAGGRARRRSGKGSQSVRKQSFAFANQQAPTKARSRVFTASLASSTPSSTSELGHRLVL